IDTVVAMVSTPDGTVWAGTHVGMVQVASPPVRYGLESGLRSELVTSLCVGDAGRLWVGTDGGGLSVWLGSRFFTFGPEHGMEEQTVNQMVDDGAGRLWMGGNKGILSVRFQDFEAVLKGERRQVSPEWHGKAQNLFPLPFPYMQAVRARDGRLAFGTNRGFLFITPPPLVPWPQGPEVKIQKILLKGQPSKTGLQNVTLPPDTQHFEVFWTGLNLKWAENIRFRYRMQGMDDAWHEVGSDRRAVFSGLAPGKYVLELGARIGTGPWSDYPTRLHLTSVPVFWETWWFRSLGVTSIMGSAGTLGYLLDRRKRKRLSAKRDQEKAVEAERARIARDLNDHLGGTITQMALYSQLAQSRIPPGSDANEYLERILTSAQSGTRALGEIVWATDPTHDTLASFVSQVAEMVRSFSPNCTRTLLPLALPAIQLSAGVRQHLYLALKEGLNNLHKHASATEIILEVDCQDERLRMVLGDNGCGFEETAPLEFGSDGLKNMRERMQQIGGQMTVESRSGQGTALTFMVPLNRLS
ncbi:MAG: hypothetical protein JWL81_978, partial [Verrucomicrobiales bacterium]|nr:hypothetical protein [Verrucomicrobiales bacterium]